MQTIRVSKTSPADFSTLQEAVLSIDDSFRDTVRILVGPGIYEEKVFIRKENIEIVGSDPASTIFQFGDGAKKRRPDGTGEYGTFNTAVILIAGKNISVKNVTIENTAGPGNIAGQALALYVAADCCKFENCRFIGYQDTIFAGDIVPSRMKKLMLPDFFDASSIPIQHNQIRNHFKNCFICGDVDFIFGPNTVYFESCEIFSRKCKSEARSFITAASTPADQEYGFVFYDCRLTGDSDDHSVYLGRPWRDYAKTAFMNCYMGSHICPEGWDNWGKVRAEAVCSYVEYANRGPGAVPAQRAPFSKQLHNPNLSDYYSLEHVLGEFGAIRRD